MVPGDSDARGYLSVDRFIRDAVGARALASALELGLVDRLQQGPAASSRELAEFVHLDGRGMDLLAGMLCANGIIEAADGGLRLTPGFREALRYRDLLEAKLEFASLVAPDFFGLFTTLLRDPAGFFNKAKLFELFSYDRCFEPTPENYASTARWMRFTTVLTRYEAAACLERHDFSGHTRMLDVGGNSGEFALRICRRYPALRATIFDLPLVCELGARHVGSEPEAPRIDFVNVKPAGGAMPQSYDLVTFKSMLHDWPDEPMQDFLARAHAALRPGGKLLIFERSRAPVGPAQVAYSQIPIMLFFRSYRSAADYAQPLEKAGFRDISATTIDLDMPFMLVTASK